MQTLPLCLSLSLSLSLSFSLSLCLRVSQSNSNSWLSSNQKNKDFPPAGARSDSALCLAAIGVGGGKVRSARAMLIFVCVY
jgi:hypothetical protein